MLLIAEAGAQEGGLFDLDATLPLMAIQVVLLTFVLNALFFRPVGKVVEEREDFLLTSQADTKQKLVEVLQLESELADQLRDARIEAKSAVLEAEQEVDNFYRQAMAEAELEANRAKEENRRAIEAERNSARLQLDNQIEKLTTQIINHLLAV